MSDRVWNNYQEFLKQNWRGEDHLTNNFQIDPEELGKGNSGVVHSGMKEGKKYAIKEILCINNLKSLTPALNEVTILKDVPPHPSVMQVHSELSWYTAPQNLKSVDILEALKTTPHLNCKGKMLFLIQ